MSKPEEPAVTTASDARVRITSPERHISITPLDMRQARFASALRGFDKDDVGTFLEEAAEGFEHALRENERLRIEMARLATSLNHFREAEESLRTMMLGAQKMAEGLRLHAEQEAARIVRDAEARVELMLQRAQAKTEDIEREIDGLRVKRREAEISLESTISALQNTLEFIREQERREREDRVDRVVQHRPKIAVVPSTANSAG
jgi:cell division initiation protein